MNTIYSGEIEIKFIVYIKVQATLVKEITFVTLTVFKVQAT